MTRELVFVHVGQCGNQIGWEFWESALREHAPDQERQRQIGQFSYDMNVLFRNFDIHSGHQLEIGSNVSSLKARAVLVDMEPGVVDAMRCSVIGSLFDDAYTITDASGSGNNWARGYAYYGSKHGERISESIQSQLEACDCCESVMLMNSVSGGTGSGLGSFILELMADEFPQVNRFGLSLFPSDTDDVVTSPYNSLLAGSYLTRFSTAIIPFDNAALAATRPDASSRKRDRFDFANQLISKFVLDITSPLRLGGASLVYPSHITKGLIISNTQKILVPSLAPLAPVSPDTRTHSRAFEQAFANILTPKHQLVSVDPRRGTTHARGIFSRGNYTMDDVLGHVSRYLPNKAGPVKQLIGIAPCTTDPYAVATLTNTSQVHEFLVKMLRRFKTPFSRRAHVHHYLEFIEKSDFVDAAEELLRVAKDYQLHTGIM